MAASRGVAILVGAGDAIGAAVARRFAKGGYTVCICRRDASKSQELVAELRAAGHDVHAFSVDARQEADGAWYVYLNGGRTKTETECFAWAQEAEQRGAGEILLTSMNHDGTKAGFALDITKKLATSLTIPVIASGGGGTMEHFKDVFEQAQADAALAASVFHFKEIEIPVLKNYLKQQGIAMRV